MSTKVNGSFMKSGLSIIIPAYNAESWLVETTKRLHASIHEAGVHDYEIIIVNDGSTDKTKQVAESLAAVKSNKTKLFSHKNSGRFLTRKKGVIEALYETILFIDTRVWIDGGSIKHVLRQKAKHPERLIWNGHINVAKKGNIIARFGDAITFIAWREYFKRPRLISYGLAKFDHYPKGTTLFLAPRAILLDSITWFESTTTNIKYSSDDTLLIRRIAEKQKIWLSPRFSATYHARTTLRAFIKHTFHRGQSFVDGFFRKGTRFYVPLLLFLILSPIIIFLLILQPLFLGAVGITWVLGFLLALFIGVGVKDSLSLFLLSPLFVIVFGTGIWRAVTRKVLK